MLRALLIGYLLFPSPAMATTCLIRRPLDPAVLPAFEGHGVPPPVWERVTRPLDHLTILMPGVVKIGHEGPTMRVDLRNHPSTLVQVELSKEPEFRSPEREEMRYGSTFFGDTCPGDIPFDPASPYWLRARTMDRNGDTSPWQTLYSPPPRWAPEAPWVGPLGLQLLLCGALVCTWVTQPRTRRRRRRRSR